MPKVFNIGLEESSKTPPKLQAKQKATVTYNVTNLSGRQVRCRAVLDEKDAPVKNKWVTLATDAEQDLKPNAMVRFPVTIAMPASVTPGKYTFQLNAVNADVTDEGDPGPAVGFEVTQSVTPGMPKWIVPVLLVVILAIGGAVTWLLLSRGAKMPDVKGKDIQEANKTLNALHVSVQTQTRTVPADQENKVLDQSIQPGVKIDPDKTAILLTIGATTKMPDVTNQDLAEVTVSLAALHVAITTKTQPTIAEKANKVLQQSIPAGTTIVADKTTVMLTVGDPLQKVPVLVAHSWIGDAQNALAAAHFTNPVVELRPATNVAQGFVAEQYPDPGSEIPANEVIRVVVASAPQPQMVTVPPIHGMPWDKAAFTLMGYGLVLGDVTGNLVPGATVQSSYPPEGQPVPLGARINLVLPPPPGCIGIRCLNVNSPIVAHSMLRNSAFIGVMNKSK